MLGVPKSTPRYAVGLGGLAGLSTQSCLQHEIRKGKGWGKAGRRNAMFRVLCCGLLQPWFVICISCSIVLTK